MSEDLIILITISLSAIAGGAVGYYLIYRKKNISISDYERKAENKIKKTQDEARTILQESKERVLSSKKHNQERELAVKSQAERVNKLIASKQEQNKRREEMLAALNIIFKEEATKVNELKDICSKMKGSVKGKLADRVGIKESAAKEEMISALDADLAVMKEERMGRELDYIEDEKKKIAKNIVLEVIQRYSNPTSVEKKTLTILVDRDEHKARIIGHRAENLLALEELTECEIIFNDGPRTIDVSCFDLYKKQIAYLAIRKLLKERFVDRKKIEQKIEEAKKDLEKTLIKNGKDVINKLNLDRKFADEFYKIVGRLQLRTSYGQNIMKHSIEVGLFSMMLGAEIGADQEVCKIGGFLHDLGKAIDHEVGEAHDHLTKKIMEEYGFSFEEVHAAWTHHDAIEIETSEALLVKAADGISAGRPGARQETLEKYLKRIRALEEIANSYEGVNKAFAISAGRELRIIVEPRELDDQHLPELAETIAEEIEQKVTYPGKIKVNVIRTTKSSDIAKAKA